jgi:hypothetical protein
MQTSFFCTLNGRNWKVLMCSSIKQTNLTFITSQIYHLLTIKSKESPGISSIDCFYCFLDFWLSNLKHGFVFLIYELHFSFLNHTGGVIVSMLASSVVDHGYENQSCQTKDYEISIWCFSYKQAANPTPSWKLDLQRQYRYK